MRVPFYDTLHLLLAAAVLLVVLYFQYTMHLLPCPLCVWQRLPYAVIGAVGTIGALLPGMRRWTVWAYPALYSLSAALALFHSGVERRWWAGLSHCSAGTAPTDIEALRAQILSTAPVRCDEILWDFLGLSMTNYNLALSVLLAVSGFFLALAITRRR